MRVHTSSLGWQAPLLIGAIGAGWVVTQGNAAAWTVVGASAALWAAVLLHLTRLRTRELVVWAVLLVCVLNFAPALISPASRFEDPLWSRVVKDVAVGLLTLTALVVPGRAGMRGFKWVLLIWAGITALVALFSTTTLAQTLVSLRYYLLYPAVAIFVYRLHLTREEIRRLLLGIVILGLGEAVLAVADYFGLGATYYEGGIALSGQPQPRAIGTMGNPNNLALFLGFPTVIALTMLRRSRRWLMALVLFAGTAVSFSRFFVPALGFAYLPKLGRRRLLWLILAVGLGAVVFLIAGRGIESASRIAGVQYAMAAWLESPATVWAGHGWGFSSPELGAGVLMRTGQPTIDNQFFQLLVEGGILGLAGFSLLIWLVFQGAWPKQQLDPLAIAVSRGMLFFLSWAFVSVNFRLFPGALLFWMLAGLGISLHRQSITGGVPDSEGHR
jgi:hypothetical protein